MDFRGLRQFLKRGGLIAYPTESCYGLGCDPANRGAVQRLLKLKGRPQRKGLILIAAAFRQLRPYLAGLSAADQQKIAATWPGPHTWLLPAARACPPWLTGGHSAIAVRVTAHPDAARLCRSLDMPLVSTSANASGAKPAKTFRECLRLFGAKATVIPGRIGKRRRPSTIHDFATGAIIRS
jgi:L-threonylcarbamoyladenylate synthase